MFAFNQEYFDLGGAGVEKAKAFINRRKAWINSERRIHENAIGFSNHELVNNSGIPIKDFWQAVDRVIQPVRYHDKYRFVDDLRGIATSTGIGDLSYANIMSGMGSQNTTQVGMKFGMLKTFDNIGSDFDKNPIPVFEDGHGMDYREYQGLNSAGVDLFLQGLEQKRDFMSFAIGDYMLNGNENVSADGQVGQGIKNHRNTFQINLGASGFNIDLTSEAATSDDIISFFQKDMRGVVIANVVSQIEKVWVSPDIMTNLLRPYSGAGQFKEGTLLEYIKRYCPHIGDVQEDFALSGNEWLGYVRDKKIISPLISLPMASYMKTRLDQYEPYNNCLVAAMGIKVAATLNDKKGVFFASDLG